MRLNNYATRVASLTYSFLFLSNNNIYHYHQLNKIYGFKYINSINNFQDVLGIGSATGNEFEPIIDKIKREPR